MQMPLLCRMLLAATLLMPCLRATALSQEAHMVTGAIVYDELLERDPRLIAAITQIMSEHPDRGAFEVALGRTAGDARGRRLFMEMARWPDDIRKSVYDHPTWHYASKPLLDAHHPPTVKPKDVASGSAVEAFALNVSVLRDRRAPTPERAIALCWIFHLMGDIHQPLHAADGYSSTYPQGDHGGNAQYVLDPMTQQPISLHWYWDQLTNRSSDAAPSRAIELRAKYPRDQFPARTDSRSADGFADWAAESYAVARWQVYRDDLSTSPHENQAPALTAAYQANSVAVAERQVALSSYRLADVLGAALHE